MIAFEKAFELILELEGGYVNDSRDSGGETSYGISKRAYPNLDIKALTIKDAHSLYFRDYWTPIKGDSLPDAIAIVMFDCAVNQGVSKAIKLLQRALKLPDDGVIGPQTLTAANRADGKMLMVNFCAERACHYAGLDDFKIYGRGWMRRLFHVSTGV